MESINLNNGILAEELASVALLEEGFNVARQSRALLPNLTIHF